MTGTIVNFAAIVVGSIIGVVLRKGIPPRIGEAVIKVEGLAILLIGLAGVLSVMLTVEPESGRIVDGGGLLLLVSLVLGCVAGELLRIDDRVNALGRWVEQKSGAQGFASGFVAGSLLFTIGAMAIVGAFNDGLRGDSSILLIKSALDFTASIVLASTLGIGVAFAAFPVLLLQGSIALLSGLLAPYLTDPALLGGITMVGYAIVMSIGFNFLCNIGVKTANLLPALLVPVIYFFAHF